MKRFALLLLAASLLAGCEDIPTELGTLPGVTVGPQSTSGGLATNTPKVLPSQAPPVTQKPVTPTAPPQSVYVPPSQAVVKTDQNGSTMTVQLPTGEAVTKVNGVPVGQSAK